MATMNGKLIICDRCGEKVFLELKGKDYTDGGFTSWDRFEKAPEGWDCHAKVGNLCPKCNEEYKKLLDLFIKKENELTHQHEDKGE